MFILKQLFYFCLLYCLTLSLLCKGEDLNNKELFSSNNIQEKLDTTIKLEARIDVPLELNLEKALNIATTQNLDLAFAKSQQYIEKWKFVENVSNWLPDYKVGFAAQRLDGNFLVGGIFPLMTLTSSINAFMRFDYRFFEGGMGFFDTLAQKKLYQSSKYNVSSTINNLLLDVTKAYNFLLKEQAQLNVYEKSIDEANAEVELNKNLEKQGVGTKFDILQSEAQLAEQEQQYIVQQARFREASIELAKLLNIEQGIFIKPDETDLKIKDNTFNKPILELISLAKNYRPEISSYKLKYFANKNHVASTFSGFLPKANFFGQYGGTGNAIFHRSKIKGFTSDAIALDESGNPVISMVTRNRESFLNSANQIDSNNLTNVSNIIRGGGTPSTVKLDDSLMSNKSLGVQVDWDIADGLGLTTVSKINQARSLAMTGKINLEILEQEIEQNVRTSFLRLQTANKLLSVSEKRVTVATEALRLAKVRLENGIGINTELLNAQKQYTGALASKVEAIIAYNNSHAELLHSLGLISIEKLVSKN